MAVAAVLCVGCKKEVALAGEPPPAFGPGSAATATPPAASSAPEVTLEGKAPAPYEAGAPAATAAPAASSAAPVTHRRVPAARTAAPPAPGKREPPLLGDIPAPFEIED